MRITNKIMQKNNLANINTNKIYQDKLSTQMATQKKISRPSDDPVVAIRSLRLRSNVTEITQYYSKNIPDAESWLKITEDALSNLSEVLTNMIAQCTKGANGDLTTENRQIILEQLQKLSEEVYATGDADYAGRYVFTGYRTDTSLSFLSDQKQAYTITEQLDNSAIDTISKVDVGDLLDINAENYKDTTNSAITEQDIESVEVYRIRLAYNDCMDTIPTISVVGADANGDLTTKVLADGTGAADFTIEKINSYDTYTDANGDTYANPYAYVAANDDAVVFVPDTGELLLGKDAYAELMAQKDLANTPNIDESEIRITYEKSNWQKGDLRPEHYFACSTFDTDAAGNRVDGITYNASYLNSGAERQVIEYDVGYNQTIQVNSTADECFNHGIGRETDDLVAAMQDVMKLESVQSTIKDLMESVTDEDDLAILQNQLDAVDKALTYAKDKEQKMFESGITAFQKYLDASNLCVTDCGARSSKLALIKNREQNQKTTYETLKSENEDIDITEVAIQLSAAELTYDAALMAAGKVMQSTLLNFI